MTKVTGPARLDLSRVIAGAFAIPWQRRATFVKALAAPALAIIAIKVGWWLAAERMTGAIAWAAWGANGVLWILFAVSCHRLVLLDQRSADVATIPGWGRRETMFLAWLAGICLTTMVVGFVVLAPVAIVVSSVFSNALFETIQRPIGMVLCTYLFASLALLLPAAAVDVRTTFQKSWRQTRGNGWRVVVVVGVLPWTFAYLANFVEGDDPGVVTAVAMTALATTLLAVEISALSLSYQQLADDDAASTGAT
jgi:hypothetical protein